MDTTTARTPSGGRSPGFDDPPAFSMAKVPCDPAQIIVNHASFRVRLAAVPLTQSSRLAGQLSAYQEVSRKTPVGSAPGVRRRPVVWTGKSAPGDLGAHGLLQAVRNATHTEPHGTFVPQEPGVTQVLPRPGYGEPHPGDTSRSGPAPAVGAPRPPADETLALPHMRAAAGEYTDGTREHERYPQEAARQHEQYVNSGVPVASYPSYGAESAVGYAGHPEQDAEDVQLPRSFHTHARLPYPVGHFEDDDTFVLDTVIPADLPEPEPRAEEFTEAPRHRAERQAYYPGRRMNLGVVLLPLRVFLGLISVYAGMGKLCDPVYFDGGERGSMVKWLQSLRPWPLAEPLRDFALQHPVGAGLTIAFLQILVGVLTVLGLWQRVAAMLGAGLSAALLVTVSWRTVPAYDAPDIIYLAAWSPLLIAGAPVYSVDGRLTAEAWRTLGPRADLWALRRRMLRRGALVAALAVGLTLIVGAVLGGAVRDSGRVRVPGPGEAPHNQLPGTPLPHESRREPGSASPDATRSGGKDSTKGTSAPAEDTSGAGTEDEPAGTASQSQGAGQAPPAPHNDPAPPTGSTGTSSSGGGSGGTSSGTPGGSGGSGGGSGSGTGNSSSGGLVGGLLG